MTRDQINIFVEERKWDYRSKDAHGFVHIELTTNYSFWLYGYITGKDTDHRTHVLYLKPSWCGYVGTWCVDCGQALAYIRETRLLRSGEDPAFCSLRTGKEAIRLH